MTVLAVPKGVTLSGEPCSIKEGFADAGRRKYVGAQLRSGFSFLSRPSVVRRTVTRKSHSHVRIGRKSQFSVAAVNYVGKACPSLRIKRTFCVL